MKPLNLHSASSRSRTGDFAGFPVQEPSATEFLPSSGLKSPTILLVDDDPDILHLASALLQSEGYKTVACSDPRVALQVFGELESVDLLITDYHMPELTGLELARELVRVSPALPVLMVSGSILDEATVVEMREKRWRFLAKPSRLPEFLSSIHLLLKTARNGDRGSHASYPALA